jgi:predicted nucleotidyltransferase component of viral defense system
MSLIDTSLFSDVADALGISSASIVEKDYWATQLLKHIFGLHLEAYDFVFAGGTCLAKAHQNTYRMSEDIDIQIIPCENTLNLPKNQQRQLRRAIYQQVVKAINASELLILISTDQKNESRYQQFLIEYPATYPQFTSLRPHLQLELTESNLLEPAVYLSIGSLYRSILNEPKEISEIPCVTIHSTASEKFVALLRRTAAYHRDDTKIDDGTLMRHVYDLHLIYQSIQNPEALKPIVQKVIDSDRDKFGGKHQEFAVNAKQELLYGLSLLENDIRYKDHYQKFIDPLVYHRSPATWEEAMISVIALSDMLLDK